MESPIESKKSQSCFFELPRELRDIIYHHLCQDIPYIEASYFGHRSQLHYGNRHRVTNPLFPVFEDRDRFLRPWLFISHAFFREVLEVFRTQAEWTYCEDPIVNSSNHLPVETTTLCGPDTCKTVAIYLGHLASTFGANCSYESFGANSKFMLANHRRIAEDMQKCKQKQELHLCFYLDPCPDLWSLEHWERTDFSCFEPFCHVGIETLVIYLEDEYCFPCLEDKYQEQLKRGIQRLADYIFGLRDVKSCVDKHCPSVDIDEERWHYWLEFKLADQY